MASYMTYISSDLLNHKINADFEHACTLVLALCAGHTNAKGRGRGYNE